MYSIVANKPGDTSVLQRKSIDLTDPKSNEILVKNRADCFYIFEIIMRISSYANNHLFRLFLEYEFRRQFLNR